MVVGIARAPEVAGERSAIDQTRGAVVAEQQRFGHVTDGRRLWPRVTAYREKQLVLRGSEPFALGLFLAPPEELPQLRTEREQSSVVRVRELSGGHAR